MSRFKRCLALLLLCALCLPVLASAEEEAHGVRMDLTFQMDASAYPEEARELLGGAAELLNALSLRADLAWRGNLFSQDTAFTSTASFGIHEASDLLTLEIYGVPSHILVGSNLLGEEKLMLNMLAWLEFSLKTYAHLNLPLQKAALLTSTYATASAFSALADIWSPVMHAEEGSRVIAREDVLDMLTALSETAYEDSRFLFWLQALLLDAGYDEMVLEYLSMAPDWADGWMDEDGLQVELDGDTESWTSSGEELFRREGESWTLTLPPLEDGYAAQASLESSAAGGTLRVCFTLEEEGDILDASVAWSGLPAEGEASGSTEISADITGEMLPEAHARWGMDWTRETDDAGQETLQIALRQTHAETGAEMLAVTGTLAFYTPETTPDWEASALLEEGGVNLFSMYEDTLTALMGKIRVPLLRGLLPVLREMPAASCQSALDYLDAYGVFDLLLEALAR